MREQLCILIVEDDRLLAFAIQEAFEKVSANAIVARSINHALSMIDERKVGLCIIDAAQQRQLGDHERILSLLQLRRVPFINYSPQRQNFRGQVALVVKPRPPSALINACRALSFLKA